MKQASLTDKTVILGVSGGIAAYKAVELLRLLRKSGADVQVVLTKNAAHFIPQLTFATLSNNPVISDLFAEKPLTHLTAVENADLMVIAPGTANVIAKLHHGVADDALTTMALAFQGPLIIAAAMNEKMYHHPATQANLDGLALRPDVFLVGPQVGLLACSEWGEGRLADVETIFQTIDDLLTRSNQLKGTKILITAGPTREAIDPVRYLTNRSTGKMGYALAAQARQRGAEVTLISGPTHLKRPAGVEFIAVETAGDMNKAVQENFRGVDVLIMSAAVSDFTAANPSYVKIKKGSQELSVSLKRTADILKEIIPLKQDQLVIGFALETEDILARAQAKLKEKDLDLIVANSQEALGNDEVAVTLIERTGEITELPLQVKQKIAGQILDKMKKLQEEK